MGRKSKYPEVRKKLDKISEMIQAGFPEYAIADYLNINTDTFNEYKKKYPEFSDALKKANVEPITKVQNSLYKLAMGYDFVEEVLEYIPGIGEGKTIVKTVKKTKKHYPGNVTAQIFYLINKLPDAWKRHRNEKGLNEEATIPEFENMSDEELRKLIEKTKKDEQE